MRRAIVLVALLSACTTDPSSPTPDDAGDGDGDMGEAGDGDGDGDGDAPLPDLGGDGDGDEPTGLLGCCICELAIPYCEPGIDEAACEAQGEEKQSAVEWWTNCVDSPDGLDCPGSCAG